MAIFKKKNNSFFKDIENDVLDELYKTEKKEETYYSPSALTPEELNLSLGANSSFVSSSEGLNPLEALKLRMHGAKSPEEKTEEKAQEKKPLKPDSSLLERCKPYTTDEKGKDLSKSDKKLYKLESVADIIKSDTERAIEQLAKKYNVSVEDLSKVEILPEEKIIEEEAFVEPIIEEEIEEATTEISSDTISIPDISDIDNIQKSEEFKNPVLDNSKTIMFTPVKNTKSGESVISITKTITLPAELENIDFDAEGIDAKPELEQSEFDEFSAKNEYVDEQSGKKLIRKLSLAKRRGFLSALVSFLSLAAISLFTFTPLGDLLITDEKKAIIISGVILLLNLIANLDMFKALKNIVNKKATSDTLLSITTLVTLVLAITQLNKIALGYSSNIYYIMLALSFALFIRKLSSFWGISARLNNLKQITAKRPKKAVDLITDPATTFAMAKSSIEGDVLVATPRSTEFVSGFMKYSEYGYMFGGKMPMLVFLSVILSLALGVSSAFYHSSLVAGIYSAAAVIITVCLPTLCLIDVLPLYSAGKRLNKKGAMIAGIAAAEKLEMANAAVIATTDIFPSGTVSLQSMRVLSENNIDDNIIKAATLTEAVGSPLTPVFKQIAKTNNSYNIPDYDDVQYEERLGLSGWVGDTMLFVGNRTLLESHGIDVPDIEIDKKILRSGFFPVYIASEGKACALVIVKYSVNPNVAKELRRITELGVTLLIENHDPNVNEEMICDYLGLYSDSVKIMSNAGLHMYKNATVAANSCIAPAAFRTSDLTFISIMNCASKIKKSNALLSIIYVLFSIFGAAVLTYLTFSGSDSAFNGSLILIYSLISTLISFVAFLFKKP